MTGFIDVHLVFEDLETAIDVIEGVGFVTSEANTFTRNNDYGKMIGDSEPYTGQIYLDDGNGDFILSTGFRAIFRIEGHIVPSVFMDYLDPEPIETYSN